MKKLSLLLLLVGFFLPSLGRAQSGQSLPTAGRVICQDGTDADTKAITLVFGGSGDVKAITGATSKKTKIFAYVLDTTATVNVSLDEGTGTNCGSGGTALTGIFGKTVANTALTSHTGLVTAPIVANVVGDDICLVSDGAATIGGYLVYCQE